MNLRTKQFLTFLTIIIALVGGVLATTVGPKGIGDSAWGNFTTVRADKIILNGDSRTAWPNITAANPFDQSLNTTDPATFTTVNTGQGANELYDMNQNVQTTSSVTFDDATITDELSVGGVAITSWGDLNVTLTGGNQTVGSYVYWVDAGTYYSYNPDTGATTSNANFATLVNANINTANGGDHYLHAGSYTLSADTGLTLDEVGTHLTGAGYDTVISCAAGFDDNMINITADNCWVTDLRLDGSNQNAGYDGIAIDDPSEWVTGYRVLHVRIDNCAYAGIDLGDGSWVGNSGVSGKMEDIVISGCGRYGVFWRYDATDNELLDFLIHSQTGVNDAGLCFNGDNNRITHGHLWGNEHEIILAQNQSVSGLIFNGVGIMDSNDVGKDRVISGGSTIRDVTFSGCEFWVAKLEGAAGTYDGVDLESSTVYSVVWSGCVFRGELDNGTNDGRYGINLDASASNCTIVACSFRGFTNADPIETTGSSGIQEVGNVLYDCG